MHIWMCLWITHNRKVVLEHQPDETVESAALAVSTHWKRLLICVKVRKIQFSVAWHFVTWTVEVRSWNSACRLTSYFRLCFISLFTEHECVCFMCWQCIWKNYLSFGKHQWWNLFWRSGWAEQHNATLCTLLLDATSRSGFATGEHVIAVQVTISL